MNTSTKSVLPLLIVIVSIFTGIAFANGENTTNGENATNVTIDPNITMPTPAITPNATVTPIATATISTPAATPNVTVDITPNITITPITTIPIPTPVTTSVITAGQNITTVSVPITNETKETISKAVPTILDTHKPTHTSKKKPGSTQEEVTVATTVAPTNGSNQNSFFDDIRDKVIAAAVLGFIGLLYEIIKIKYENKQKAKLEQINEDTQNKLLEKLERRQEKLLAQHGISDKRQYGPLDKPEKQQEDINDQNKKV